jgi:protein phosphatase 1G
MGNFLESPVRHKQIQVGQSTEVSFGAVSMQGWRVTNEDTHLANVDLPGGFSLFGVFDGHGGSEVA